MDEKNDLNNHSMITRSKKKKMDENDNINICIEECEKLDNDGNILDLIDDSNPVDFDNEMFQKELNRLRGIVPPQPLKKKPSIKKRVSKKRLNNSILDIFIPYILSNILSPKKNTSKPYLATKKRKKREFEGIELDDEEEESEEEEEEDECEEEDIIEHEEDTVSEISDGTEGVHDSGSEGSDFDEGETDSDDESFKEEEYYDKYDEEFMEIMENDINEDEEIDYFHNLTYTNKVEHLKNLKEIKEINKSNIPLRFKVLNSNMDLRTKSIAIENIDKLSEMDVSTGEYCKMDKWINGLIKIPFGKYKYLKIDNNNTSEDKQKFILNTYKILDSAIYGHKEAKMHILQVIGKWIKNPRSQGNVLALQGPMGNGKTTLVKEGIAKAINRPFAFIALGGASDSSFFDGHSYTYEGSHWGRIIDILIDAKCMNPIIYFDELDKVSETHKGEEIIHLLTHLTDPSQNNLFQDNYFPGVHIDLSKALFIFSFNNESKVDRILKDRMYVINTKGFKPNDKIKICNEYILPELMETFLFDKDELKFTDDALLYIIEKYTLKEEGVRNLKRCLETIISKINIYNLSVDKDSEETIPLGFKIKDFEIPLKINRELIEKLISTKEDSTKPPEHMYM